MTPDVLIVTSSYLGDVILSLPTLVALATAGIPTLALAPAAFLPLLQRCLSAGPHWQWQPETVKNETWRFSSCQEAWLMGYRPAMAWHLAQAGVARRLGLPCDRRVQDVLPFSSVWPTWGGLLTQPMAFSAGAWDECPQYDRYTAFLQNTRPSAAGRWQALPLPVRLQLPHWTPTAEEQHQAQRLFPVENGPATVIQITSRSPGKTFPKRFWQTLLDEVMASGEQTLLVALGLAYEAEAYGWVAARYGARRFYNLCGTMALPAVVSFLAQRSGLVLCLDSGLAHLAALARVPRLMVLYGPTSPRTWRPLVGPATTELRQLVLEPLGCRPCLWRTCCGKPCVAGLAPDWVARFVMST